MPSCKYLQCFVSRITFQKKGFLCYIVLTLQGLFLSAVETQVFVSVMSDPKVSMHLMFAMTDISAY